MDRHAYMTHWCLQDKYLGAKRDVKRSCPLETVYTILRYYFSEDSLHESMYCKAFAHFTEL
jgi:hypothetical protein